MASSIYPITELDSNQVIKATYDESTQSVRTTAVATIVGDVFVEVDAADGDNIAIASADGTKKVDVETVSGKNVLDTQVLASALPTGAATEAKQDTANVSLASIDTKLTAPLVVEGNKTDNSAAAGTNNVGVLPAVVHSLRHAFNNGNQSALCMDVNGFLRTSNRSENIIGDLMVDHRVNQIEINFSQAFNTDLITNTTTNGGTATQANGKATYSTSTNVNGTAKGVSTQTINYRAGSEIYSFFTAAFTTPTDANSFQRIGIFDDNNGFYIGYEGTDFGISRRSGAADTFTKQSDWNGDPLDGSSNSAFTRMGVIEALDFTKLNVFRIVFSWFGAAPIRFEVLSPDVKWVVFHTINYPNTQTGPSILNPNLPLSVFVSKIGSDATNLSIITSCWAGGSSMDAVKVTDAITDYTLAPLVRSVITGHTTAGGGSYVNVKVNPSGALTVAASQDGTWSVEATQTTADNLNVNANVQIGDIDVSATNPVPTIGLSTTISVTPTISTSAYAADDQIGDLQTIASAVRVSGGTAVLQSVSVIDKASQLADLDILFFDSSPTIASSDNAALDISDTEMASKCIGFVRILGSNYSSTASNSVATERNLGLLLKASGSTSLYAVAKINQAATYTSTSDLIFRYSFIQD